MLLVSGSTRARSTNTAALRTVREVAPPEVEASLYEGLSELPAFNPDDDQEPPSRSVPELRRALAAADAVLFCTPEYAGSLPGSFKNLLDWTVGSGELYGRPVAWVNVAAEGRGRGASAAMATVLGYVGAEVIDEACVRVPLPRDGLDDTGAVHDPQLRARFAAVLTAMLSHLGRAATGPPPP